MSDKRLDAVWRVTKALAERVNAARAAGLIVINDGARMDLPIEINEGDRFIAIRYSENSDFRRSRRWIWPLRNDQGGKAVLC